VDKGAVRTEAVQADSGKKYFVQVAASSLRLVKFSGFIGVLALALLLATAIAVTGGFFLIRSSQCRWTTWPFGPEDYFPHLHERMPIPTPGMNCSSCLSLNG